MSLTASGPRTFPTQQVQNFLREAQANNTLSANATLNLQGETVTLEQLQAQIGNNTELEQALQKFINNYKDTYQSTGNTSSSSNFSPNQDPFGQTTNSELLALQKKDAELGTRLDNPNLTVKDRQQIFGERLKIRHQMQDLASRQPTASPTPPTSSTAVHQRPAPGQSHIPIDAEMKKLSDQVLTLRDQETAITARLQQSSRLTPAQTRHLTETRDALRAQILQTQRQYEARFEAPFQERKSGLEAQAQALRQRDAELVAQLRTPGFSGAPRQQAEAERQALRDKLSANANLLSALTTEYNQRTGNSSLMEIAYNQKPSEWANLTGNSDLDRLKRNIAQEAGGIANNMSNMMSANSGLTLRNNLALDQGNNAVYAQLLNGNFNNIPRLATKLQEFQSGQLTAPTQADQDLLKAFGLQISNGKLYNAMSQKEMSPESVSKLIDSAQIISRANTANTPESQTVLGIRASVMTRLSNAGTLGQMGRMIDQKVSQLQTLTGQAEQQTQDIKETQTAVGQTIDRSKEVGGQIGALSEVLTGFAVSSGDTETNVTPEVEGDAHGPRLNENPHVVPPNDDQVQGDQKGNDNTDDHIDRTAPPPSAPAPNPLTPGTLQGATPIERVKNMTPQQLEAFNRNLSAAGLSVERGPDGSLSYKKNNTESLSEEAFWNEVNQHLGRLKDQAAGIDAELKGLQTKLTDQMRGLQDTLRQIKEVRGSLQGDQAAFDRQLGEMKESIRSMREMLAARGASMPPEERQAYEEMLADMEKQVAQAESEKPARDQRVADVMARSDKALAEAEKTIKDVQTRTLPALKAGRGKISQLRNALNLIQQKAGEWMEQMMRKMGARLAGTPEEQEVEEKTQTLIKEANELENTLRLAQAPSYEGIEEAFEKAQELQKELRTMFNNLQQSINQGNNSRTRMTAQHSQILLRNLQYHTEKLDRLQTLRREEQAQVLAEAVAQAQRDLNFTSRMSVPSN